MQTSQIILLLRLRNSPRWKRSNGLTRKLLEAIILGNEKRLDFHLAEYEKAKNLSTRRLCICYSRSKRDS